MPLASLMALTGFLCYGAERPSSGGTTNRIGEKLVLLKSGEAGQGGLISYGLYDVVSGSRAASRTPPGRDLVLVLRNNGAKWIDFEHITVENFNLKDSQNKDIKLSLLSSVRGMGYGESEVIHLGVDNRAQAAQPWTLRFKSQSGAFVPVEVSIAGIEPGTTASPRSNQ